MCFRKLTILK
ncbi:hypothetical protein AYI69_g10567, partial [Smittium culicis]